MEEKLKSHFLNLYCMVIVDGEVSPTEKAELLRIGKEHYGFTEDEINKAIFDNDVMFYIPPTDEEKLVSLYELVKIANADGHIEPQEMALLKEYAKRYGILEEAIDDVIAQLIEMAKQNMSYEYFRKQISH